MKRYDEIVGGEYDSNMEFREDGDYVLYSDVSSEIHDLKFIIKGQSEHIEVLEKRVKELEWQPIETAPRDGTPVDLWHKNGFTVNETWWTDDECWSCVMDDDQFSHWKKVIPPQV